MYYAFIIRCAYLQAILVGVTKVHEIRFDRWSLSRSNGADKSVNIRLIA
jgi:hypothetical protein